MIVGTSMKSEWESMTIDDLFALREQMQEVLSEKLKAKKVELERRLQQLNQQSKRLPGLLMTLGHCGCAWTLLPLVSSL
jgi:hypothetical protein